MRKSFTFLVALALSIGANAQSLPRAVYTLDFEGSTSVAEFSGKQIGEGALLQSDDPNFGIYYQNAPTKADAVKASNYLRVENEGLAKAASNTKDGAISISLWVNPTLANTEFKDVNYYYTVLFGFYPTWMRDVTTKDGWNGPFNINSRLWMQINDWQGCWDDFTNEENVNAANKESTDWLKQKITKEIQKDDEGNETEADVPTGFDDNWHHVALVLSENENTTSLYVDGELQNQWTNKEGFYNNGQFFQHLIAGTYTDLYLPGVAQWDWNDPCPAFAYDDITFYAGGLSAEQIQLIMNIKSGNIGDAERLIIAQGQLENTMDVANDYSSTLADAGLQTLADALGDYVLEIDPLSYTTVVAVNAEIAKIQAMIDADQVVLEALKAADKKIQNYTAYGAATGFNGINDFSTAIDNAKTSLDNVESVETIVAAMTTLEQARIKYIFTQTGDVIDVTRVIDNPWFVDETYEPTVSDNAITYEDYDLAAQNLSYGNWSMPVPDALKGASDYRLMLTNGRTTANLFHSSTVANIVLDVQQTITDLPAGYYEVSADMSSTSKPTNNHVYAQSGGFTKVSPNATSFPTFIGEIATPEQAVDGWINLTTNKVYVGEDGTLTIGATSTTDGTAYTGWFCVTNFRLKYYGTEYNMDNDVQIKSDDVNALITELNWQGDITNATNRYNTIINSDADAYTKVSQLTELEDLINSWISKEEAFDILNLLTIRLEETEGETAISVYTIATNYVSNMLNSETMSVDNIEALNSIYTPYIELATTAQAAADWGTNAANSAASAIADNLTGNEGDKEAIEAETDKLIATMKSSITDFEASLESPKDITFLVGDASFDGNKSTAWTRDGNINGTVSYNEIEFWNTTFNIHQTITNMPKGVYKVTVSGFYRDGDFQVMNEETGTYVSNFPTLIANNITKLREDTDSTIYDSHANVYLYAKTSNGSRGSSLVSLVSDSIEFYEDDKDTFLDDLGVEHNISEYTTLSAETDNPIIYYTSSMVTAYDMITNRNLFKDNEVVFVVAEDNDDITIGVRKDKGIQYDWALFDNFRLFYVGQETPDAIAEIDDSNAIAKPTSVAYYTISGAQVLKPQGGIYIVKYANGKTAKQYFK